jgi:exonuclease III
MPHARRQTSNRNTKGRALARCMVAAATAIACFSASAAHAGSFAVMSYNVKGLPPIPFVIGDRSDEMKDIADRIQDFHSVAPPYVGKSSIVGLQEVFWQDYYDTLTNPQRVSFAYMTSKDTSGSVNTGDGLTILSDFKIEGLLRTTWDQCFGSGQSNGGDCETPKGFNYVKVTLEPGAFVDLYTLHADAGQDEGSRAARRNNITQLVNAINERSPEGNAVIVLGDTNSHYTRVGNDNIQDLLTGTGVHDVWVELRRSGVVPEAGPDIDADCETTPSTGNCEEVDKIFYRDGATVTLAPQSYEVLRQMFMGTMTPLSDHDPVAVEFDYTVVGSTTTTTTSSSTSTSTSTSTTTLGDRPCGDPIAGGGVAASDALFVLKAAVGARVCPLCTCDTNDNASVSATDALIVLKFAVGQSIGLNCPLCEGATTTTTIP